jgi:uncharacterized membrane protein
MLLASSTATPTAASYGALGLIILFTIINLVIYHKCFRVVYFDLGKGIFREIFFSAFIAMFEAGLVVKFGKIIIAIVIVLAIILSFGKKNNSKN